MIQTQDLSCRAYTFASNVFYRAGQLSCLVLALSLAACGGDDGGTPAAASAAQLQPQQSLEAPGLSPPQSSSGTFTPSAESKGDAQANDGAHLQAGASQRGSNRAPTIAGMPAASAPSGRFYEFRPSAHDPDGDVLTYSIAGKPSWATFSAETGELRGIPGNGHIGTYENIVISASDGRHTVSLPPFSIDVRDGVDGVDSGRASITLNWLPPTEDASGKPLYDLAGYKIYWGSQQGDYPNQVTIKSPGIVSYVLEQLAPGRYYIVLTAFNSRGEESGFSNVVSNVL